MLPTPCCPAGHALSRWRNRSASLVCDGECDHRPIPIGVWRWSCTRCDYDICEMCAGVKSERAGRQAAAANGADPTPMEEEVDKIPPRTPVEPQPEPMGLEAEEAGTPNAVAQKLASAAPASTPVTDHELSWVYMPQQVLDSVRKDLGFRPSEGKVHRPNKPSSGALNGIYVDPLKLREGLSLPLRSDSDPSSSMPAVHLVGSPAPELLPADAAPDLKRLPLPQSDLLRMLFRRQQLQHVFELEVARETRAISGAHSDFEASFGIQPAASSFKDSSQLAAKFEEARNELLLQERMEIEAFLATRG
ncbi:MAG: hypothetical protein SGPRY_006161 [Prymnesium sp.]